MSEELMPNKKAMLDGKMFESCGVLFKMGSGIIICGEVRTDGDCFFCKRCLKEIRKKITEKACSKAEDNGN